MKLSRLLSLVTASALTVGLGFGAVAPAAADESPAIAPGSVGIQMFMHNWNSIASECTSTLGPEGIKWVLVMPPQEHIQGAAWWTHYQPVSYKVESRLGTRAQFAAMTAACNAAGVKVIADAVINHMSASQGGTGWAGTTYTKYNYPGLYSVGDFHACHTEIIWGDAQSVRNCELLGLSDLDTSSASVREKIVGYLKDLLSLGVSGFRIDAAKHIAVDELKAIRDALPAGATFINEVYNGDGIRAVDYLGIGSIFDFNSAYELKSILEWPGDAGKLNAKKQTLVALPPSEKTITMVTNHDTERGDKALTYKDAKSYVLAMEALLARTYGTPMLFSGYAFSDRDQAPLTSSGLVSDSDCANSKTSVQGNYDDLKFTCEQRWNAVRGMIAWRNFVGTAAETKGYGRGGIYATARGSLGYFLMNSNTKKYSSKLVTGMKPGTYCDLVSAGTEPFVGVGASRKCAGLTVKVDAKHRLIAKVASMSSVAITKASKLK